MCEIKTLFVDGGQRGRGYGRRLLGRALSFAAQSGYRRAALDTRAQDTAAIALYKSVGFYETTPYHDNPYADIFMELIL
ncbi:GNAT family N-acetyltransferase [Anaerotruncus colihominis]|uniref:GNAT family N-acetyltransferase n=1 Tax=Anaerotruncus colihominis TaxID=169435 RepID=UPI00046381EB|nr:GNAT family N-acetyltransferase [Anaerotruncus colihominis]UOX67010.1 GNAT family N-acetyltransferase [Anaerotruncus colihominis]